MDSMVDIQPRGTAFALIFTDAEAARLGLEKGREYELTKAQNGVWVLLEGEKAAMKKGQAGAQAQGNAAVASAAAPGTPAPQKMPDETEQKIIGLLRKTAPRDRMEGWFEKKLSDGENAKFAEMLKDGRVVKFKSSETFRKALYTLPKIQPGAEAKRFENREKPIEEYTLEKDGFIVVKNEFRAKAMSEELQEKIKAGEIRGIRSFSGEFFIITSALLIPSQEKALAALKTAKSAELAALSEKTGFTPTLVRICMEFLKEEGQVIEKRKGIYQYIE